MKTLFIQYPKCSTCQKAKQWLDDHGIEYCDRHIVEQNPDAAELTKWIAASGLPARKFFNTSGILYREMDLGSKLDSMDQRKQIELLAANGMLVKRPLVIREGTILVGFKPAEWEKALLG